MELCMYTALVSYGCRVSIDFTKVQNVCTLYTYYIGAKVPFLLTFYVPNLGSRTQNMTSLAF